MTFSRRTLSVLTVLLLMGVLGAGVWWRLQPEGEDAAGEASAAEAPGTDGVDVAAATQSFSTEIPQPVRGAEVLRDTLWVSVRASGRAKAFREARIVAQVPGMVTSVPVRENAAVGGGQPVLQIDTTELALAVARARSDLLNAQAQYRSTILFDDEIDDPEVRAQREQYARAQSGLNAAEVGLREAELDLARSSVRAPFEGRVADVAVVPGQHVTAGTELMTIVDLDPIKVEAEVLEAELPLLREGRRAEVRFAAFPGETFTGRVESINPVVGAERTGRVTIVLSNSGGRIKPGMYAEVSLEAEAFPDRLLVPRSAVLERGETRQRTMLFVYEEDGEGRGLARWRYVTTGHENEEYYEIVPSEEGTVEPGEIVLVDGHHYLAHDTRVRLVEEGEAAGLRPGA